jgi:hypothetical protein
MNDPMLDAIEKERKLLRDRLAALDEMERRIRRAPRPNGTAVQVHAPTGALREAILSALGKSRAPIYSSELKRAIREAGYSHSINGQYFTKTLRRLVGEKKARKVPNGAYSTYELVRRA